MTLSELQKHLGARIWSPPSTGQKNFKHPTRGYGDGLDIQVPVEVIDVRQVFDRTDCLITTGHGQRWVSESTLSSKIPSDLPA